MAVKSNTKKVQKQLAKNLASEKMISKAMVMAVESVRTTAINSILRGTKTGHLYKYNPRRTHTASAEGEPPKVTLEIWCGITTKVEKSISGSIQGQIIKCQ